MRDNHPPVERKGPLTDEEVERIRAEFDRQHGLGWKGVAMTHPTWLGVFDRFQADGKRIKALESVLQGLLDNPLSMAARDAARDLLSEKQT